MPRALGFCVLPAYPGIAGVLQLFTGRGVRSVCTAAVRWHEASTPGDLVPRFAALVAEHGLSVSSCHMEAPTIAPLAEGQARVRDLLAAELDLLHPWNPATLVVHWGRCPAATEQERVDAIRREIALHGEDRVEAALAANLAWFADLAAARHTSVALENLPPPYLGTMAQVLRTVRLAANPALGVCVDSGHANCDRQDPARCILEAGSLLRELHLHDNWGPPAEPQVEDTGDKHLPPGLGTIHWPDVVRALRAVGYAGPATFEVAPVFGFSADAFSRVLDISIANWRAVEDLAGDAGTGQGMRRQAPSQD